MMISRIDPLGACAMSKCDRDIRYRLMAHRSVLPSYL